MTSRLTFHDDQQSGKRRNASRLHANSGYDPYAFRIRYTHHRRSAAQDAIRNGFKIRLPETVCDTFLAAFIIRRKGGAHV